MGLWTDPQQIHNAHQVHGPPFEKMLWMGVSRYPWPTKNVALMSLHLLLNFWSTSCSWCLLATIKVQHILAFLSLAKEALRWPTVCGFGCRYQRGLSTFSIFEKSSHRDSLLLNHLYWMCLSRPSKRRHLLRIAWFSSVLLSLHLLLRPCSLFTILTKSATYVDLISVRIFLTPSIGSIYSFLPI